MFTNQSRQGHINCHPSWMRWGFSSYLILIQSSALICPPSHLPGSCSDWLANFNFVSCYSIKRTNWFSYLESEVLTHLEQEKSYDWWCWSPGWIEVTEGCGRSYPITKCVNHVTKVMGGCMVVVVVVACRTIVSSSWFRSLISAILVWRPLISGWLTAWYHNAPLVIEILRDDSSSQTDHCIILSRKLGDFWSKNSAINYTD